MSSNQNLHRWQSDHLRIFSDQWVKLCTLGDLLNLLYSKTCLKWPLSKRPKLFFKTNYRLMQVKSIAECSKGSILQYFGPSLNYHLSLRSSFCLFLSGRLRQDLLYCVCCYFVNLLFIVVIFVIFCYFFASLFLLFV